MKYQSQLPGKISSTCYLLKLPTEVKDRVHYENTPIQIYRKYYNQKKETFLIKNSDIFHISSQNIDCGYSLELPQ